MSALASTVSRLIAAIVVIAATSVFTAGVGAVPAQAGTPVGYVRLAHLSPDTPEVDVYLNSQSGAVREQVFTGVGYGVLSAYQALPVGGYTVAMRPTGAPRSTPAVLTTQVSVTAGDAYTVAGVGRYADLGLRVLTDDLSLPSRNKSKVRIVQGSVRAPVLGVSIANGAGASTGTTVAENVAFATTTDYQVVEPGTWRLVITPAAGGAATEISADLREGSVYTLIVLDGETSGLTGRLVTDATRQGGIPLGGVNTGGGGAADDGRGQWLASAVLGTVLLSGAVLAVWLSARRRRLSRVL